MASFSWMFFFLDVFFPSFLHSFAVVSLPRRLLLLPLHKTCRGLFLCSSNWSVLVGPQPSLLVSLILLQAVSSEEYYNNNNRTELFFLSFFRFFSGGCFLGSRKHHNFVANFCEMAKRLLGVDGVAAHMIPGLVRRELYLHHGTRLIDPRGVVLLCLGTSCSSNSVELCSHSSNRRHWFHQLCSCFISKKHSTTNWVSFSCFCFFGFCFCFCTSVCVLCAFHP